MKRKAVLIYRGYLLTESTPHRSDDAGALIHVASSWPILMQAPRFWVRVARAESGEHEKNASANAADLSFDAAGH